MNNNVIKRLPRDVEELLCKSIKYDEKKHIISLHEIPSNYNDKEVGYIIYPYSDEKITDAIDIINYYKDYYGIKNIDDCNFAYSPGHFCNETISYNNEFVIDNNTLVTALYPITKELFLRIAINISIKYHYYVILKYGNECFLFDERITIYRNGQRIHNASKNDFRKALSLDRLSGKEFSDSVNAPSYVRGILDGLYL